MKSFKSSLRELNALHLHPLLAAFVGGLLAVGMAALVMQDGVPRADAWMLFLGAGAGGGILTLLKQRQQGGTEQPGSGPTNSGPERG